MSVLQKLTEGIVNRSLAKDGQALLNKWENTGLLEGLDNETGKNTMACLLENQAKELLREASAMSQGDVEGFAAVAFPIVRRVFGGLIANDIVSVQPMSLPSGLIFFLDFQQADSRLTNTKGDSVYGGGVVGKGIAGGVSATTGTGYYDLSSGYASPTGSVSVQASNAAASALATGKLTVTGSQMTHNGKTRTAILADDKLRRAVRFDADVEAGTAANEIFQFHVNLSDANAAKFNLDNLTQMTLTTDVGGLTAYKGGLTTATLIRRLTHRGYTDANGNVVADTAGNNWITFYYDAEGADTAEETTEQTPMFVCGPAADGFGAGGATGAIVGQDAWGLEGQNATPASDLTTQLNTRIPEIDIKVDSIAVSAVTKKLKAKWTPELGQDLNAYHNLDAEVELTGILSEQIALEIDQEILNDLVQGATAGTLYWSRRPGQFLDPETGSSITSATAPPDFTGTVSEWYETLVETVNDVSARIHRKTLRGGANFIVCGPEVANVLEFTSGFRANIAADDDKGTVGAVNAGSISKKWDVWVDPYFPRNVILVGRKGSSFLESGYVYAPYVPLQVTPTIFGDEDFLPRKGVMTRYAKKMVRPDMYGLVVVRDLIG
jgi:hypothetical protein